MTSTVPAEFGSALRAAIERSGLSLDEISRPNGPVRSPPSPRWKPFSASGPKRSPVCWDRGGDAAR
ncbi:hypothetical protein [Amycolatopsis speibonae]|uniref:Uncharacterized protein n=1 Tax=Amycolatopsis speibonae TaxID=1450224 RepID=A0ABV7NQE0_9PSEU